MIDKLSSYTTLHNGVKMPWLGLGVWQSKDGAEVENAISWALEVGYRSIDTASIYQNESGVGNAILGSQVPRSEIFLTTKVWNQDQGYESTFKAFETSLEKLKTDYVDLYLIHWPVHGKFAETWKALEEIYRSGKAKAIGVSNFLVHHLKELLQQSQVVPMVNQVEFHPYLKQPHLQEFCLDNQIQLEAWSPLMQGKFTEVQELAQIGEKYNKTPAQVILRWDLEHGVVTIPKSVKKERLISNADIFDFELTPEEIAILDQLDKGHRFGPDPDNFDF